MKPIVDALPQYDYIYLGDTANLPYGDKSLDNVYRLAVSCVKYLLDRNCALVLIMCNTISAESLRRIQREFLPKYFPDRRILGIIIPTVKEVHGKRVGVLATQGTVKSETYIKEVHKFLPYAKVFQQAAPKLVPIIEKGLFATPEYTQSINNLLLEYLEPLLAKNIDTLILGCTHFVILKNRIRNLIPEKIRVISQDELVAEHVRDYLSRHPEIESVLTKRGMREYRITKLTPEFEKNAKDWYGESLLFQTSKV